MKELKLVFRALADVSRLDIVHQLSGCGEITVTDLVSRVRTSQPLMSWHLRMLKRAGLVRTRRVGRTVYCSLNRDQLSWALAELSKLASGQPIDDGGYSRGLLMVDKAVEA